MYYSTKNNQIKDKNFTKIESQNQTINFKKLGIFTSYFSSLTIGRMLNKAGITKTKGASPLELFTIVFKERG